MASRVLIVDDEPVVIRVLSAALGGSEFTIDSVDSAEAALDKLSPGAFDVLIVDKNLPGRNGINLVRELRSRGDDLPAILITGYASAASAAEALNVGVDAYLEKPFGDLFAVAATVRRVLAVRQRRKRVTDLLVPKTADESVLQGMRILVGSSTAERCAKVITLLDRRDEVAQAVAREQLLDQLASFRPDLVILEGVDTLVQLVDEMRASAVVPFIAVAEQLPLGLLRHLIEMEVRSFVDGPLDAPKTRARLAEAIERYRGRKLIHELSR